MNLIRLRLKGMIPQILENDVRDMKYAYFIENMAGFNERARKGFLIRSREGGGKS